ncbi:14941_t:CDS:2, partial [Acaulospora colombiana]
MDNSTSLYANQPGPSSAHWKGDEDAESQEVIIMEDLDHQYPPGANQRAARSAKPPVRTPKSARLRRRLDPTARRRALDDYGFTGRDTTSFRHALFLLLEQPTSSSSAFTLHLVTNTIIVLSAFLTILETIPAFHAVDSSLWFGLETGIVVVFSVEYGARSIGWGFERGVWDDSLETFVDADGVKSHFESIPAAAWFVLVRYGEIIPRSFFGRLVTVPLLLFGLLLVALPSFVLGREFAVVWEEMSAGVLDGIGLARSPQSPITPYTGQEAEIYGALPDDEDDDKAPLTGGKGKGRAGNILFDSGEHEADHTATTRSYSHDEEKGEPHPATPAAASTTSSH